MKRSRRLLRVYAELRRALGDAVSAGETLEIAERLTELANYREIVDRCGTPDFSTPGCVPVDRAFDDGGWALLHDVHLSGMLGEDEHADYSWQPRRFATPLMEHWA